MARPVVVLFLSDLGQTPRLPKEMSINLLNRSHLNLFILPTNELNGLGKLLQGSKLCNRLKSVPTSFNKKFDDFSQAHMWLNCSTLQPSRRFFGLNKGIIVIIIRNYDFTL